VPGQFSETLLDDLDVDFFGLEVTEWGELQGVPDGLTADFDLDITTTTGQVLASSAGRHAERASSRGRRSRPQPAQGLPQARAGLGQGVPVERRAGSPLSQCVEAK
jgi:hypothetical protein